MAIIIHIGRRINGITAASRSDCRTIGIKRAGIVIKILASTKLCGVYIDADNHATGGFTCRGNQRKMTLVNASHCWNKTNRFPLALPGNCGGGHFGFSIQNLHQYALPEIRSFLARKGDPWLESCHQLPRRDSQPQRRQYHLEDWQICARILV